MKLKFERFQKKNIFSMIIAAVFMFLLGLLSPTFVFLLGLLSLIFVFL